MNSLFIKLSIFLFLPGLLVIWQAASFAAETAAQPPSGKPVYYPLPSQTPLRVGEENYQKNVATLKGLKGVYINIDDVLAGAKSHNLQLQENLKAEVARRLNAAGIRLLSKEEMEKTPGQPEMGMFPSYPKHLGPFKKDEPVPAFRADCCLAKIWTSFSQGASVLRAPLTRFKSATWGEGHDTTDCTDIANWLSSVVLKTVDDFIADKQKGDQFATGTAQAAPQTPAQAPAAVTPAETGNMECNTSLMMYIEMFKTNSSDIMPSKYFVLDKLAEAMKNCPNYNYLIETHADQRADFSFNEKLTKDRARAIQQYLSFKGVEDSRFEIKWYGETHPVTMGTTDEDYASNRRVVVTPYRAKKP
ncbi:hypothetical protein JCM14076_11800 [Methylosoma difficile]